MFTGIIEEIGSVNSCSRGKQTILLKVNAKLIMADIKIGDSIAVNGVCLTVTTLGKTWFTADVMPITYNSSNLFQLKPGSLVNLERALLASSRLGGHIVSGHIDGVARICLIKNIENAVLYQLMLPPPLMEYCIAKGSIAIDGTSLTLATVEQNKISVALIPHTKMNTTLSSKKVGEQVNIECDIVAKQIARSSAISKEFLLQHGFL
jgi:riboflavin synthase